MIGILELSAIGRAKRTYSTSPYLTYSPTLEISEDDMWIGEVGSLPGTSFPEGRDIAFTIPFDGENIKYIIASAVKFYIYFNGTEYLISSGKCSDIAYDPLRQKLTGRISPITSSTALYPSGDNIISDVTFPREDTSYPTGILPYLTIGSAAAGKFYPTVIGIPGRDTISPIDCEEVYSGIVPGSPAYLVESGETVSADAHTFLIAGHHVLAQSCVLFSKTRSESPTIFETPDIGSAALTILSLNTMPIQKGVDKLGNAFSYITCTDTSIGSGTLSSAWALYFNKGDEFFIKWCNVDGTLSAGGLKNPYGGGLLTGAGDIIRWAADISGQLLDSSSIPVFDAFNSLTIDTYLNEPINLWEWALTKIIPLTLSITGFSGEGAWCRPIPTNFYDRGLCVKTLTSTNSYLEGQITYDNIDDIITDITISYAPIVVREKSYAKVISASAETSSILAQTTYLTSKKSELILELDEIYSDASAARILAEKCFWYGTLWARGEYILVNWTYIPRCGDIFWCEVDQKAKMVISWKINSSGQLSVILQFPA